MHPKVASIIKELDPIFNSIVMDVFETAKAKIFERAPQYEAISPLWMRLNAPAAFQTMISLKAHRVASELEQLDADNFGVWNEDNAIDLIVFTVFLIAYTRFIRREEK